MKIGNKKEVLNQKLMKSQREIAIEKLLNGFVFDFELAINLGRDVDFVQQMLGVKDSMPVREVLKILLAKRISRCEIKGLDAKRFVYDNFYYIENMLTCPTSGNDCYKYKTGTRQWFWRLVKHDDGKMRLEISKNKLKWSTIDIFDFIAMCLRAILGYRPRVLKGLV